MFSGFVRNASTSNLLSLLMKVKRFDFGDLLAGHHVVVQIGQLLDGSLGFP